MTEYRFCPCCGSPLSWVPQMEDGGEKLRLRCTQCDFTDSGCTSPCFLSRIKYNTVIKRYQALYCFLSRIKHNTVIKRYQALYQALFLVWDSRWTSPCFLSRIKHNTVIKRYQGFRVYEASYLTLTGPC